MAKTPKTQSGKAKGQSKKKTEEIVEAEVLDETGVEEVSAEAADSLTVEDVPEDSDYEAEEPSEGSKDAALEEATELEADTGASVDQVSTDADEVEGAADDFLSDDKMNDDGGAVDDVEPEEKPAPVAAAPQQTGGGMFGSVLGGAIAGAIGFLAAMLIFPQGWQAQNVEAIEALQSDISSQQDALAEQTEAVSSLGGEVSALSERIEGDVSALKSDVESGAEDLGALSDRLDSLTKSDGTTKLPDDVQILLNTQRDELDALREEVAGLTAAAKTQMEAAVAQQETAEQAEARVKARAALQDVRLALVSGEPFAEALPEISGAVEVPEGLQAVASDGVPTAGEVQAAFPNAARAALAQALRAEAGSDTQSRLQLFFKDQLGARSLTPREGDDADAVLSRAEAAVKADDYATALSEIEALPDTAKAEFADWRSLAEARVGAVDGFEAVSAALNEN